MRNDPEEPVTLGLAKSRYLDSLDNADDEPTDPEDAAEDLAFQQERLAETQMQAAANLALGLTDDEREDLWAYFRDHQWIVNVCNLTLAAGLLFFFHSALFAINQRLAGPLAPSTMKLFPDPILWWIWPFFAGICFAWELTILLWGIFGSARKAKLYRIWAQGLKFNYKGSEYKAMGFNRWFMLLILVPGGVATALALNMHAIVGPAGITDCGYASKGCTVYQYADVIKITRVAMHETSSSRTGLRLVLDFKDGRRWITSDWGNEVEDIDPALQNLLIGRIGLPVAEAARIEDIPEHK